MTDIEAIMDLARVIELGDKSNIQFHLWLDKDGKWYARVDLSRYYERSEGDDSAEKALKSLRDRLTSHNRNLIYRIAAAMRRWVGDDWNAPSPPNVSVAK